MHAIFLSASVPQIGHGTYHETADPFLIQFAVRELVTAVIRERRVVWGGHPAITPMVAAICADLRVNYDDSVVLYQSRYFEDRLPDDNRRFPNLVLVDAVGDDRDASLLRMREAMVSRSDLVAAVFIGGMEGVEIEYELFRRFHPNATALPVAAPGGAARRIAERLGYSKAQLSDVDFARLFHSRLGLQGMTPQDRGGADGS